MNGETRPAVPGKRRQKGPRPKHVPRRMCIACREHSSKRGLIRIVRTPEGPVEIDPTGKRNGRGAYLCERRSCWDRALTSRLLANALKIDIDLDTLHRLRSYAAELPVDDEASAPGAQEGREA